MLTELEDVTPEVLKSVESVVDDWYPSDRPWQSEEFIDTFCDRTDYDMESYVSPAALKIMRHARNYRNGLV